MKNILIFAFISTIIFIIFRLIMIKYTEKEEKPLKLIIKDALAVFVSIILCNYGLSIVMPSIETSDVPNVFTDNAGF